MVATAFELMNNQEVLIIGSGVNGLSCGIKFLEAGFGVKIIARDLPPKTTSNTAAAIWYPYKAYPEDKVSKWGEYTLKQYYRLTKIPQSGITTITLIELCKNYTSDPWWKEEVRQFRYLSKAEIPTNYEIGYEIEVPLIDTPIYMNYLLEQFRILGGSIELRTVFSLGELEGSQYNLVVNCAGLGAKEITSDDRLYPIRGQLVKIQAQNIKYSLIDQSNYSAPTYIVPRSKDCILGGTAQDNDWSLKANDRTAKEILSKCQKLEPSLKGAKVIQNLVGLRPGRKKVRLELEEFSPNLKVIHNYGHGGAGFTLSWGCAREVLELARAKIN